jgi:hypothetical protein
VGRIEEAIASIKRGSWFEGWDLSGHTDLDTILLGDRLGSIRTTQ